LTQQAPPQPVEAAAPSSPIDRLLRSETLRYLALLAELALVLYVIVFWYQLEGLAFRKFAVVLTAGFAVHYVLPARLRLPFFALLSLAGIVVIFGWSQGAWLIGIGLALIGLCNVPVPFPWRWLVVGAGVAALSLQRSGHFPSPWSRAIWPILGSMFMLRLVLYLYEISHRTAKSGFWRSVAYFFMLPNVCFPLFPVVDYETFCRTEHNEKERTKIYQSGLSWMVRGVVQLVLYRVVYQHLPMEETAVVDAGSLLRYLIWPFLLYLHVSGLFHLTVGMLHLFGFNLPETHHLFYLASSFTDFWRRINIYWKDFMLKLFYFPAFFRLRSLGQTRAIVLGTFFVFFATWVLHSWQYFWLRGEPLLKWNDAFFWTVLAGLVAVNAVHDNSRPMRRRLGATTVPWRESLLRGAKTLGVFATIALLWSLWISESVTGWLALFALPRGAFEGAWRLVPWIVLFAIGFIGVAVYYDRRKPRPFTFWGSAVRCTLALMTLMALGVPEFYSRVNPDLPEVVNRLRQPGLNSRAVARRQRDYYEKLNDVGWDDPELAKVLMDKPADWGSIRFRTDLAKLGTGLPYLELLPNASGRHRGALIQLNQWGFRYAPCEKTPAEGVYRMMLVGSSHTFGAGVAAEETFGSLLEREINAGGELGVYDSLEIINAAVEGYSPLDVLAYLDEKVLEFHPEALVYVVHPADELRGVGRLAGVLHDGLPIPYPAVRAFADSCGVDASMPPDQGSRLMTPRAAHLLDWSFHEIAARCRERGITPVLVFLAVLDPREGSLPAEDVLALAAGAGFRTIDLSDVYAGQDTKSLELAPWDDHPNAIGHRLVAERLVQELEALTGSLWRSNGLARDQGPSSTVSPGGVPPRRESGGAHG